MPMCRRHAAVLVPSLVLHFVTLLIAVRRFIDRRTNVEDCMVSGHRTELVSSDSGNPKQRDDTVARASPAPPAPLHRLASGGRTADTARHYGAPDDATSIYAARAGGLWRGSPWNCPPGYDQTKKTKPSLFDTIILTNKRPDLPKS